VLEVGGDARPGRDLVGREEAALAADLGERRPDADDVRRALGALLRLIADSSCAEVPSGIASVSLSLNLLWYVFMISP